MTQGVGLFFFSLPLAAYRFAMDIDEFLFLLLFSSPCVHFLSLLSSVFQQDKAYDQHIDAFIQQLRAGLPITNRIHHA